LRKRGATLSSLTCFTAEALQKIKSAMSYTAALLVVLLIAIAAAVATIIARHALDLDIRRQHHEVGNPVYLQIGVVFAVLLAFVFSEVWGEYNVAAQAINGECGALHGAALLAHGLPDQQGQGVERAILDYTQTVINKEWAALGHRDASPEAVSAFEAVVEAAARLNIARPGDAAVQSQMLALLAQAHAFRETRSFQAARGLPVVIWLVLASYAHVLVAFVLFAGVESLVGHLLFTVVFAVSVALVLILVRMLDYPFEGALALSNADFVTTLEHVRSLTGN
jgi:hypothetical protein